MTMGKATSSPDLRTIWPVNTRHKRHKNTNASYLISMPMSRSVLLNDIAFSCIFNQKLQGQVFQQQNCSRVSECCILSSRALALAACNCTDSCNSYTTMLLHWKENHRKTIALLQANLPCLLSKNGCTDTCVSYTMFSLSLLLTSVDVELLPPRTLAI